MGRWRRAAPPVVGWLVALAGVLPGGAGCPATGTGTNPNALCTPGETRACTCFSDAGVGIQTCTESGVAFTECDQCMPAGASSRGGGSSAAGSGGGNSSVGASSRGATSAGASSGGSSGGDCSARARLIYVVDQYEMLSAFDPATLTFSDIGYLNCPALGGASAFSMAVQRNATAWVLYNSGELFRVDTATAACSATGFVVDQGGMKLFGMGFVSNVAGSAAETLHIAGGPETTNPDVTRTLATLSMPGLVVSPTGSVAGSPELTGTGAGELYGFFPSAAAPRVAWLNKVTGAEREVYPLPTLAGTPQAWAFAFWGGDWWVFLQRDTDVSTNVSWLSVNGGVGTLHTALTDTGRHIVGAGVSTCAPLLR